MIIISPITFAIIKSYWNHIDLGFGDHSVNEGAVSKRPRR